MHERASTGLTLSARSTHCVPRATNNASRPTAPHAAHMRMICVLRAKRLPLRAGCAICHLNHNDFDVILCDSCSREFHRRCLPHPLASVPAGQWYCSDCRMLLFMRSLHEAVRARCATRH
ncbi:hypothetical protein EON66_07925 [archaeon]|nr:MAG: hypothetical protein EON66_07925 [archaeon]